MKIFDSIILNVMDNEEKNQYIYLLGAVALKQKDMLEIQGELIYNLKRINKIMDEKDDVMHEYDYRNNELERYVREITDKYTKKGE